MKEPKQTWLGVTSGLRGYFAVLYDEDGPIQTGIGSYETAEEAASESLQQRNLYNYTKLITLMSEFDSKNTVNLLNTAADADETNKQIFPLFNKITNARQERDQKFIPTWKAEEETR